MALTPAWAVDGGRVPASVARTLAWCASKGATGVVLPADLRVTALPAPAGAVNVQPGGAVIASRYGTAGKSETYVTTNDAAAQVTIPPTGSSGARTDYIIIKIGDWHYEPNLSEPAEPLDSPYCSFQRVSSLNGIAYPYVPLAKVTIPASTTAITPLMISDLREVANPRQLSVARYRTQTPQDPQQRLSSTTRQLWPAEGGWQLVDVPSWATRVQIKATWSGIKFDADAQTGRLWVSWGDWVEADGQYEQRTDNVMYDAAAGSSRQTVIVVSDMYVPGKYRGDANVRFAMQGRKEVGAGPLIDYASMNALELTFLEVADPSDS